jgi:hypothetical protein
MTRNRASAKKAGASFEKVIANFLADHVDERIERRARNGSNDRGDISGVRTIHGDRVVIECKNTTRLDLAGWTTEADLERGNDDAMVGLVVSKRHGKSDPALQWVHMTLADLVALLCGDRPAEEWLSPEELAAIDEDTRHKWNADAATWTEEDR